MPLKEWIDREHNGSQTAFAEAQGVEKQQVTKWLKMGCVVVDGTLFSPRRKLK